MRDTLLGNVFTFPTQKKSKKKRSCLLRFRKVHMVVKGLVGLAPGRRETQKSTRDGGELNGGNDTSWWNKQVFGVVR